jgi:GNAT superfamily N-acetyltransferase
MTAPAAPAAPAPTVHLHESDRESLLAHFVALDAEDRRLRFGTTMGDSSLREYVARIDFEHDCVFAVQDENLRPVAVVHVATSGATAELGLSVLPGWRGQGNGNALLQRAVTWLRNRGTLSVYVHCIAENARMMHLARRNGMRIVYSGAETDGRLELDAPTAHSFVAEWMEDQRGQALQTLRKNARWMLGLRKRAAVKG